MPRCEFPVYFPEATDLSQGQEYFFIEKDGKKEQVQLHDYLKIYSVPWLYEEVLYELLKCNTPVAICDLLEKVLRETETNPLDLRVLEIGAGSGIFAQHLRGLGIKRITGLDILEIAHQAAERDRPGLYDDYYVADLTDLSSEAHKELADQEFNCVAVASATGWGNHIPVLGFATAFELLAQGGWFIFHVKRDKDDAECLELCDWIDTLVGSRKMRVLANESCFHRYSIDNKPIFYDVIIGSKS